MKLMFLPLSLILLLGAMPLPALADTITIMTFNVENLFDNTHDQGKNDETYLPLTHKTTSRHIEKCRKVRVKTWRDQCLFWDWNDAVVAQKLKVLGLSIKQVNAGAGPDIIAFQEVENLGILERLRAEHLDGLGYHAPVLLEGNDIRGIDVAFLSKLPMRDARLHNINFSRDHKQRVGDTRPILEVTFDLPGGESLIGFAVHFPAPFHPTSMRESAYAALNQLLAELPRDQSVFAAGDFNTTREENAAKRMLARWVRPLWEVAHDLCEDCPGTSYYPPKDDWSFLDTILWRAGGNWRMTGSFLANGTSEQMTSTGTPKRFRLPGATGVSDHWPLVMVIER